MTKYLTGSKRLQVIQRWLQGHDDPEYDVLPTKKEGKYIVKKRKEPLKVNNEEPENLEKETNNDRLRSVENEENNDLSENEDSESDHNTEKEKPIKANKQPKKTMKAKTSKRSEPPPQSNMYDPTINLEILNQLKILGDEIKAKREKKEQKRMIKEVVQKQFVKRDQFKEYIPQYQQSMRTTPRPPVDNIEQQMEEPQNNEEIEFVPRRRNNVFKDFF